MSRAHQGPKKKVALSIYKGFNTMPALILVMRRKLFLPLQSFVIVRFLDTYYGVAFGGPNREVVVGEDVVWYRKDWIMQEAKTNECQLPYEITALSEEGSYIPGVWRDMRAMDPGVAVFRFDWSAKDSPKDITALRYARAYVTLLGLTFYDKFWTRENLPDLDGYFDEPLQYERVFRDRTIRGINPFRSRVLLNNGAIRTRPFYRTGVFPG